jgi:inosine-uridine nucleoside N-ribohydrolase/formylmethanofuran dehydrogenase subunit E
MLTFAFEAVWRVGRERRPGRGLPGCCCRTTLAVVALALAMSSVMMIAATQVAAHEGEALTPVVVDTDLGLDDAVALAMILQDPDLEILAAVAGDGVADAATGADQLARLVEAFNRTDVAVYRAPSDVTFHPPAFRGRARAAIDAALALEPAAVAARPLVPEAYLEPGHRTTVLALGPLTRVAGALTLTPEVVSGIERVVVSGDPDDPDDWNLSMDRGAFETVRSAGVPVTFVRPGDQGVKPGSWYTDHLMGGQRTALGEALLDRLLADPDVRGHYLAGLASFHDELAALYLTRPELFTAVAEGIVEPLDANQVAGAIADVLSRGRQRKDRVVFVDGPLPAEILRDDVRSRRDAILAANGPDEWFSQLLLNELHEHLGAYSIIGVKMGLRAAELLNAPQHAMTIVSSTPAEQPVSCLNDGLLVATGSTPGRGLFSHTPGPSGTVAATFAYNGRTVTLRLKDEYRARVRTTIQGLLERTSLDHDDYWDGVRELGLDIWLGWHRRDLFEIHFTEPSGDNPSLEIQP